MWLLRRLSAWLEATPDGISVELPELAQELGLGANVGRSSPVIRTLARLLRFQAAAPRSEERRVGKECVSTCRSRWAPCSSKKNTSNTTTHTPYLLKVTHHTLT